MTQLEASKKKPQRKWLAGKSYRCVVSTSPGYKVGEEYAAYKNGDDLTCLRGRDGFEDICTMLVSGFKDVSP